MKQEFLKLYDTTVDEIYGFCYYKLSDRELAKSITQDTYAKMWASMTDGYPMKHAKMILQGIAAKFVRQHQDNERATHNRLVTTFKFS